MPRIGMRMIKSAISVFICFLIYLIRGIGMPFYSAIAAILCIQPGIKSTEKVAINRIIGTFIGGAFGVLILLIERRFIPASMPEVRYLLTSVAIIPLIYITVLCEQTTASYISCVVFLSITVNHGSDVSTYGFAINRIIDTLIGIFVALGVNTMRFPRKRNYNMLFVSDLHGTLLNYENKISSYTKLKLNEMLNQGALITFATDETPEMLISLINDIDVKLPIITMDGAALYNLKDKSYVYYETIDYETSKRILDMFSHESLNCFTHTIINDVMHIYYGDFTNPVEKDFYNTEKLRPFKNYIYSDLPKNREVVYFKAMDKLDQIKRICNEIAKLHCESKIRVSYEEDKNNPGYYILEIYSIEASKSNALMNLKGRVDCDMTVYFGGNIKDVPMIKYVDYVYAVDNAQEELKEIADYTIGNNDTDSVIKTIRKLFYSRKKVEKKEINR